MFNSGKKPNRAPIYSQSVLDETYGIHSSLTAGIPANRIVFLNTEAANTNGETLTDNQTVGYSATAGATAIVAGVVKAGGGANYTDLTLLPGFNRDINCTVTTLGKQFVEVAPGTVLAIGAAVQADNTGRAVATGGAATGLVAHTATNGTGTADNPEFVCVFIK